MADYDIADAFAEIEDELLDSMMRNFRRHRAEETAEGYNWAQWQAMQLKSLEKYRSDNQRKLGKRFGSINEKIEEMLRQTRADGNAAQETELLEAVSQGFKTLTTPSGSLTAGFFGLNDRKLDSLIKATENDLKKAEHAVLRLSYDKYRSAIFNAQVYMNTGTATYEKAVDMAVRDLMRAGLNCVEYRNGARHTLSDYADMALRTANKRAYLMGEGEKRKDFGITTVVVNSRLGGCPRCARYIGRVFIDDVYSGGTKADGNYPLLSEAIEGGLFHPRCKDSTSTYFEGITTLKPVSEEEMREMERREQLEQKESYCRNEAKKNRRISKHSLDPDNKRIYAKRAEAFEEKAEKIEKTLENSGESGILKEKKISAPKSPASQTKDSVDKAKPVDYSSVGSRSFSEEARTKMLQQERIISGNSFETGILYDSNGEVVFVKKGKADEVHFSKNEISKMRGGVLTHNHPDGSVFSPEDINMLRKGQLSEIRACNGKGAYVLRSNSEWNSNIADLDSIDKAYWDCYEQAGMKYRDIAAQEGKHILMYVRQMQEEGIKIFCDKFNLEFTWEARL